MRASAVAVFTLWILSFQPPLVAGAQLIEGLVNIRFQPDVRVFAVMAAINAGGFEIDARNLEQNPARRITRERLSRVNPDLLARIQRFYQTRNVELDDVKQQSKYVSFALILRGPPEFKLEVKPKQLPPDTHALIGFETLVKELWEQGGLQQLWEEVRPYYAQEVENYRPLIHRMILDTLRYFRTDARVALDREVVFIPDPLNGYGIVNARNVDPDYILVVGPSRASRRHTASVRHEYLHFMIDPLIVKYSESLPPREPFLEMVRRLPDRLARYENDLALVVSESLIQVVELRLDKKTDFPATEAIIEDYEEGLILAPYFDEGLDRFEARQDSFHEFVPELIRGIQLENEKEHADRIHRLKADLTKLRSSAAKAEQSRSGSADEVRNLLARGNQLLLDRQFSEAKEILEQVLKLDSDNASAMFGLAQVLTQAQDFDRALDLYARAADRPGTETWIRAWCFVRRGNIRRFQGDITQARQEWSRVQELQGDLKGAAEAAGKALAETTP
jgi:tetratricopeptide (TPR) repeat protein